MIPVQQDRPHGDYRRWLHLLRVKTMTSCEDFYRHYSLWDPFQTGGSRLESLLLSGLEVFSANIVRFEI